MASIFWYLRRIRVTMNRLLFVLRYVLITSAIVLLFMYFVDREQEIVTDDNVEIVVIIPKVLFGNQKGRTMDRINRLNSGTGLEVEGCPKLCKWTMDRNNMSNADAVVFYFFTHGYWRLVFHTELNLYKVQML